MSEIPRRFGLHGYGPLLIAVAAGAALVIHSMRAVGFRQAMTSERGGVETAALVILGLLIAALIAATPRGAWHTRWALPAGAGLLLLREMDFHDWFFEPGLLHLALLGSDAPLWHKAVSLSVMAWIAAVGVALLWHQGRQFATGLRHREGWALAILATLLLFAASTVIDGADRKLAGWGMILPVGVGPVLGVIEEIVELVGMLCLLWSFALWSHLPGAVRMAPGRLRWQ